MLIGHYAVALAAKKVTPKPSLGTLVLAAQFSDLLWPILTLLGLEHARIDPGNTAVTPMDFYDYPISHSLLTTVGWALVVAVPYYLIRRDRKAALVIGGAVISHWVLDLISRRPDMPLIPGWSAYFGLGLWNSIPATVIVEGSIFVLGVVLYLRSGGPGDRTGKILFWILIAFLSIVYIVNFFTPPPPNLEAVSIAGISLWIIIPWSYRIDRRQRPDPLRVASQEPPTT